MLFNKKLVHVDMFQTDAKVKIKTKRDHSEFRDGFDLGVNVDKCS